MYDISDIKNYILFLRTTCGLSVSLHPIMNEALITSSDLIMFNVHDNPYCIYVKSFPQAALHCVACQKKVFARCAEGSFCGRCFAGVREYVYPISNGAHPVGFVSVSGYRSADQESCLQAVSQKYGMPADKLHSMYCSLSADMPDKKNVDTLIMPLCSMLELAYMKSGDDDEVAWQDPLEPILRYIKRHYTQNITIDDICREFDCSRSYISHHFKQSVGQSFREYLTDVRIANAKLLLRYSKLDIAEIALTVGFRDYTYFSNTFKKKTGSSPSAYRKK